MEKMKVKMNATIERNTHTHTSAFAQRIPISVGLTVDTTVLKANISIKILKKKNSYKLDGKQPNTNIRISKASIDLCDW